jgi:hypothetical protein
MTLPVRATCPRCGAAPAVFIRSKDGADLVCLSCREDASSVAPNLSPPSSRRLFGKLR